jgi:hypothetical protein
MDRAKREAIAARLAKIAKLNGGRVTPDAVLADAQNAKSPLHDQFEWDDTVAARQYRLQQARELIRSVKVEITTNTKTVSTVRYVRDPSAGEAQGYVEVAKLRDDKTLAAEALQAEIRQANALVARARSLAEALGLGAEIEMVAESVDTLQVRLADVA